jgi:hypothetical protein
MNARDMNAKGWFVAKSAARTALKWPETAGQYDGFFRSPRLVVCGNTWQGDRKNPAADETCQIGGESKHPHQQEQQILTSGIRNTRESA